MAVARTVEGGRKSPLDSAVMAVAVVVALAGAAAQPLLGK